MLLSEAQIQQFKIDGYLVLPSLLTEQLCSEIKTLTQSHLEQRKEPFELEAELHYPGAPESKTALGGETIRRLLMAYHRDPLFKKVARNELICNGIKQILDGKELLLNPNHHNCMMTKSPEYSSETLWHRDTRYWNFDNKYLINAWFAIGEETQENGAMRILPGSHRWEVQEKALDKDQFLILDHPDNMQRLETARTLTLNPGDALLFSAHCFHAAGRNMTDQMKYSLVFTYHTENTKPLKNTVSDKDPEISTL